MSNLIHALAEKSCSRASLSPLPLCDPLLESLLDRWSRVDLDGLEDVPVADRIDIVLKRHTHRLVHHLLRLTERVAIQRLKTEVPRRTVFVVVVVVTGDIFLCQGHLLLLIAWRVQQDVVVLVRCLHFDEFDPVSLVLEQLSLAADLSLVVHVQTGKALEVFHRLFAIEDLELTLRSVVNFHAGLIVLIDTLLAEIERLGAQVWHLKPARSWRQLSA